MNFRLLGPVELDTAGGTVAGGPPRQCLVLAALLADAGRLVTLDQLIDRVWGQSPPTEARRSLHAHIVRVRQILAQTGTGQGEARVVRRSGGYLLDVAADRVDVHRFQRLVARAGEPGCAEAERLTLLREAVGLWRGEPLAGLPGEWAARFREGWHRQRVQAVVAWARAELQAGNAGPVIAELTDLVGQYPLVEPLVEVLMRALFAAGRSAEALDCYTTARARLVDELGIEPGPELQQAHRAVLRGEIEWNTPVTETPRRARCTLPVALPVFVGRDKELDRIATAMTDAAKTDEVIAIHVIDGMPGIGKTALAVHVGHRLAEQFPDGQLFVDLHAHTPGQGPVPAGDALADLLAADGVDPRFLPNTVDGRARLWRDRMAQRRLLLVLDNAVSTEQVLPLLPGSPSSLVLVTSRRSLGDLPSAVPIALDVLAPGEAVQMFLRLAPRAAGDPRAVADLVHACGHLPLAVSITASLYSRHPSWTVVDLRREVHAATGGVLTVKAENRTVAAVFDLSYQHLPADRQRFFRLLGVHLGVEIDAYAAAALTGVSLDEAAAQLDELYNDHLLKERTYRRYQMHDLVRDYAHTLATTTDPADVRERAVEQLLDYYQYTASHANTYLSRRGTDPAPTTVRPTPAQPEITSRDQAAAWLRTERANLLACIHYATTKGQHARTIGLTAAVAVLLRTDGPWTQAIDLHNDASAAAHRLGDRHGMAATLHNLADARRLIGDYAGAADLLGQCLDGYRALGDRLGEADALHDLGRVRYLIGDYPAAADLLGQCLDGYRALGDRLGEADALHDLGRVRYLTGDYPAAIDLLGRSLELCRALGDRQGQADAQRLLGTGRWLTSDYPGATDLLGRCLDLYRALGDRHGQATALRVLGSVRWLTGDYPQSADILGQSLQLCRLLGDRRGEAEAFHYLGRLRSLTGDYSAAADLLERSLDLYRTLGHRHGEASALDDLGVLRRATSDYPAAAVLHRQALDLHHSLGYRHGEAVARARLAVATYLIGDYATATALLQQALTVIRQVNAPDDEAETLNHLGILHRLTGHPDRAQTLHRQALTIARTIHHRREEAHALEGIGRAALDLADTASTITHLRQAWKIYQQLGAPEAVQIATDLAAFDTPV